MAVPHILRKIFSSFKGLDKRSSHLTSSSEYAIEAKNVSYKNSGAITKRKGSAISCGDFKGGFGLTTFKKVNTDPNSADMGQIVDEIVSIGDDGKLYRAVEKDLTFTITSPTIDWNTASGGSIANTTNDNLLIPYYLSIYPDSSVSQFRLTIYRDGYEIINILLGTGKSAGDPNISYLVSTINAALIGTGQCSNSTDTSEAFCVANGATWYQPSANISVTADSDITSKKAAFLDTVSNATFISGSPLTLKYTLWEEIPIGDSVYNTYGIPFTIYSRTRPTSPNPTNNSNFRGNTTNLENASFAQVNNVLYISNGFNDVMKYDGEKVYRAGLPAPSYILDTAPTLSEVSLSSHGLDQNNADGKYYFYKYKYEYTDAIGNIISSEPSPVAKIQATGNNKAIAITYKNLMPGGGFNVDTADRIKIKIYRTKQTETEATEPGAIYYLVNSFATPVSTTENTTNTYVNYDAGIGGQTNGIIYNDKLNATSTYLDFLNDSSTTVPSLNELLRYLPHKKRHDLPPKGKYLTVFQNCLVVGGQRADVNNISYSLPYDIDTLEIGSEYFPNDTNQEIVESQFGGKITALAPLKDILYIFHNNSIHTLSGSIIDMSGLAYQIDLLTEEGGIGCEAHATVQELASNLFFLSKNGIYSINNSEAFPREISLNIQPEFKELITTFNMTKALSFNWNKENSLVFVLPTETFDDGAGYTNKYLTSTSDSKIFVYDYSKQAWLEWTNLDYSGGVAIKNDTVYFSSRELTSANDYVSYLYKMKNNKNTYDYVDNMEPIQFSYTTSWEALEEPTLFKKFLRVKLYAFDSEGDFESPSFMLNADIKKNYSDSSTGTIQLDFGAGVAGGWGAAPWGSATWGSNVLETLKTKLPTGKAKALAINFNNKNINENVLLSGYELEIAGPYKKEIKE